MSESDEAQIPNYPCSVVGQDDIYGVGIRVGLYVQWYCTTLAYLYSPKEAANFTVVNYCFSIAVAIAAIVHRAEIYQHEVVIIAVLMMLPPTVIVVAMIDNLICWWLPGRDDLTPQKPYNLLRWLRDFAGFLATAFLLCVGVWELFDGVKQAKVAPGCWPEFVKAFYISGPYEIVLKVVAIMFAVLAPMFHIFLMVKKMRAPKGGSQQDGSPQSEAPRKDQLHPPGRVTTPLQSTEHVIGFYRIRSFVALFWGMIASFVIAKIETIIKQNKIQGMMDPLEAGQLIPLIVGGLQFCIVTYTFMLESRKRKDKLQKRGDEVQKQKDNAPESEAPLKPVTVAGPSVLESSEGYK